MNFDNNATIYNDPKLINANIFNPNLFNPNLINPNFGNPNFGNANFANAAANFSNAHFTATAGSDHNLSHHGDPNRFDPNRFDPNRFEPNLIPNPNLNYNDIKLLDHFGEVGNIAQQNRPGRNQTETTTSQATSHLSQRITKISVLAIVVYAVAIDNLK